MSEGRDENGARVLLRELTTEVRQWAEWTQILGADALPTEPPLEVHTSAPGPGGHEGRQTGPDGPPAATSAPGTHGVHPPDGRRPTTGSRPPSFKAPQARARAPRDGRSPLGAIRAELGDCTRCGLHAGRKNLVFGVGSETADLVIIGEAPGRDEDLTGEPFVGRSGQLLTRMLAAIGLRRDEAYICNVLKCRPPQNRDPAPDELATCSPFVIRQVQAIEPRVIMTVGRFASKTVLGSEESMGRMRGQTHTWQGFPVVPTYHPAYLLRNPAAKREAWEDLLRVRALLRG